MRRSTHATWDPDLGGTWKFTPARATGHGWQPKAKRFTRTLELAIVESVRERQQRERERRAALIIRRAQKAA